MPLTPAEQAVDLEAAIRLGFRVENFPDEEAARRHLATQLSKFPRARQRLVQERARQAHGLVRQPAQPADPRPEEPPARPPSSSPVVMSPSSPYYSATAAAMAPGMRAHAGAIDDVNDAISQEMRSRVAQSREQRRMQQEQQMKEMQLQELLIRLQHEREMVDKKIAMDQIESDKSRGVMSSTRWNQMLSKGR